MQPEPEVSVPSQIAITPLAMRIDDEEQEPKKTGFFGRFKRY